MFAQNSQEILLKLIKHRVICPALIPDEALASQRCHLIERSVRFLYQTQKFVVDLRLYRDESDV